MERIYFDNAATTPLDPIVLNEMKPYLTNSFGNASSLHRFGTESKVVLEKCRKQIANYLNASDDEFVFTSSGTESNNMAIKGIAFANRGKGNHIITSAIEHDCVLNACKWLETQGFYITYLSVDSNGVIDIEQLRKFINPKTILVSVMHGNNEIGTLQNLEQIGMICREKGVYFHSDACQSFGKVPIDVQRMNLDLLTINSHKIYGPKGVGGLFIRKGVKITPWLHGGGQEFGIRSSTENIAGIVGFTKAVELCMTNFSKEIEALTRQRDKLMDAILSNVENAYLNGHPTQRIPNNINICIRGLEGEAIRLLLTLDELGIAVSAGSACSSNDKSNNASHVLRAIGLNPFEARGSIRISLGRFNTDEEIDYFINAFEQSILKLNPIFS
ncbi:MAG: cysteine desulfurase [Bacteroidales bacterium]|nr:cysteine desulfurase [Bacteroidales bacterium]